MSKLAEAAKTVKFYDPAKRPAGSNADEWVVFIEEHLDRKEYLAVQISEALEAAEQRYLSAVKGRQEFRKAYRESRITENYNDTIENVDRFNRETGGGV